jgi:hypothetical protein
MKAIIVFCMFLIATMPVFAGTWRDDFENEQDFMNDCQNGVWIEEINPAADILTWENGAIKADMTLSGGGLAIGDSTWKDYTVECKLNQLKSTYNGAGILLRHPAINGSTAYFFGMKSKEAKEAGIYLNFYISLNTFPFEYELDRWYSLKAVIQGNQLEFYIDGKLMATAKDDTNQAGWVGFGTFGTAVFDDFVMTGPEVKDGGHWDPKAHEQLSAIKSQGKIIETWGRIKNNH